MTEFASERQDHLGRELLGPVLANGDSVHTMFGELLRLGTDAPGGVIVEGAPFGFKAPPAVRDVRVIAAGWLRSEGARVVAELRTPADSREARRFALVYSFAGPFQVKLDVKPCDDTLVGHVSARAIVDVPLPWSNDSDG